MSKSKHLLYTVIVLRDGKGRVVYAQAPDYEVQQFGTFADPGAASQEFKNTVPGEHEYIQRERAFLNEAEGLARERRADLAKLKAWQSH